MKPSVNQVAELNLGSNFSCKGLYELTFGPLGPCYEKIENTVCKRLNKNMKGKKELEHKRYNEMPLSDVFTNQSSSNDLKKHGIIVSL